MHIVTKKSLRKMSIKLVSIKNYHQNMRFVFDNWHEWGVINKNEVKVCHCGQ